MKTVFLFRNAMSVFFTRKMLAVLLLGFSSGLPLALTGTALQAWMTDLHVDIKVIGLFSLVSLPYMWKFLWAPLMDRFVPPLLGRRRGWILITQIGLVITIAAMAFTQADVNPSLVAIVAFLVCFFSASQDIVIDAYKTEVLDPHEFGAGASLNITGYRIAMLVSGALALILADHMPWQVVYLIMAACMVVGIIGNLTAPEPVRAAIPPKSLKIAVVEPLRDFFVRKGSLEVVAFIIFYRLDVVLATTLMTPFILEMGFTKTDIGAVTKGVGLIAILAGGLVGGAVMSRIGIRRSLWAFGLFQGVSGFAFVLLAHYGHNYPLMVAAIVLEQFCSGMGTSAYAGFLMSLCKPALAATQYALLSSLMRITYTLAGALTGFLVAAVGWQNFYLLSIVAMVPGLLLLTRYNKWSKPNAATET